LSDIKRRAHEARELLENAVFQAVLDEIRQGAVDLFMNANSGIDVLSQAHERVRAIETVLAAIQARIDAETVEDNRKAQHRE